MIPAGHDARGLGIGLGAMEERRQAGMTAGEVVEAGSENELVIDTAERRLLQDITSVQKT